MGLLVGIVAVAVVVILINFWCPRRGKKVFSKQLMSR